MRSEIPEEYRRHLEDRGLARTHAGPGSAITVRGILVGCVMCVAIALAAPYTTMLLRGTPMGFSSCTPA